MRVILVMTLGTLFTGLTQTFKNLREWYQQILNENPKPITTETKNRKNIVLSNINQLYNKYFDTYKKNYDSEKVKDEEKKRAWL